MTEVSGAVFGILLWKTGTNGPCRPVMLVGSCDQDLATTNLIRWSTRVDNLCQAILGPVSPGDWILPGLRRKASVSHRNERNHRVAPSWSLLCYVIDSTSDTSTPLAQGLLLNQDQNLTRITHIPGLLGPPPASYFALPPTRRVLGPADLCCQPTYNTHLNNER